uniref:Uncharacterized protein n=1 Tax=Oncorhynchus mykiss TaxID=8022 RepID=A0A8K9X5T9_ONCMY
MIAYVDCLSTEPVVGGGVGAQCWKGGFSEDEDELLPACSKDVQKMLYLQPKSEGSLRRRLLTSKIHQQRDGPWASRPLARRQPDNKGLQGPLHRQDFPYPGPSPPGLVRHHRAGYSSRGSQQHTHGHCLTQLRKTSYFPPTPDHHPGYSFPPSPLSPPGAASYSHTGPSGYPNPGPPGYPNSGLLGYPNRGSAGYPNSNPGHCKPAYNTTPSSSLNPGHCNPAYNTNPSSSLNPGHCKPAYNTNHSSSPNPGHCFPAYKTNPSSNPNPGHCNPAYKTNPSSNPNPGHCNPAYKTNPSSNPNPGHCNPAYKTNPSSSPNPGHCFPAYKTNPSSNPNPGHCNPAYKTNPSSNPNPGHCNPAYKTNPSSNPNPGHCNPAYNTNHSSSPDLRCQNTAQGHSNTYLNSGYPSPRLGYGPTSLPGPGYSSGFAPQSQPSLPTPPPKRRKRFYNLLRRRSYNTSQIPFSHTPLLHTPKCQDWRAVRLDEDKKWSVHYTSQKPQQETRPSCVDDRRTVLRECSKKLRRVGYGSSQYFSQNPAYLSPSLSENRLHDDKGRNDRHRKKSTGSSPDEDLSAYSFRPPPSPPPNSYEAIDDTVNGCDITANSCDLTVAGEWTKPLPLPTPEEKMRQQAQAIAAEIVPINITGEGFERQASFRRALANTDTLIRQPRNKLTRRKTIAGIPDDITRDLEHEADEEPGCGGSVVLPGQYSTLGRTGSVNTALLQRSLAQGPHTQSLLPSHTQSLTPSHTQEAGLLEERREEERVAERRMEERREEEREERRVEERRKEEREEERRMDERREEEREEERRMEERREEEREERREEEREEERRVMKPSVRRIRAQRGQGISSLMASLTPTLTPNPSLTPYLSLTPSSSMGSVSLGGEDGGEGFHSLPRQDVLSSLSSESSCLSTPYRTFCSMASCSMDHEFLSQSGEGRSRRFPSQSTLLGEDWSYEPLLPSSRSSPLHPFTSISSSCQTDYSCSESHGHDYATGSNRSPHGNRDHRGLHGNSRNLSGSISLRKSKRPPAPPTRSTSLRFKAGRGETLRYNYNNHTAGPGEVVTKGSLTSSPAPLSPPLSPGVFEDPWVPRCSSVDRGGRAGAETDSQINHVPPFHSFHQQPGQDQNYPSSPSHQQPHPSVPRSASAGGVSLLVGPKMAASSPKMSATAGRPQRLASSTSSGYSSECNTPTLS